MIDLLIFGCGGHARSVADVYLSNNPTHTLLFIDENAKPNETLFGFQILNRLDNDFLIGKKFLALGNNQKRKNLFNGILKNKLESIISSKSYYSSSSKFGDGIFIGDFCHIGPMVVIGDNTIINTGAIIEHEVIIGSHCHIAPNTTISGRSIIGNEVFIGVGATVIDNISICDNVIVGAGAVVVTNITKSGTYVGIPAKLI